MDDQLESRLQSIEEAAEAAAVNAGAEIDILPIRNEIEDAEDRLATFIRETSEALADRLESNRQAIQRLHERVDQVAETVEAIQTELPE